MTAVLDSGALIALERGDRRMLALAQEAVEHRIAVRVPAGVVAQVWRGSARQHALSRLLVSKALRVESLDEAAALAVGRLLAATGTADVVDAHVALTARRAGAVVVTSDPDDIRAIDGSLRIQRV